MVTRVEKIENYFLEKIASNELKPGDQLPKVREIKEIFNVGHVTAANVLKGLSDKGSIKTVRGHGAFISQPDISSTISQKTIIYACGHGLSPELTSFYMRAYQGAKDNVKSVGYDLDFIAVDLLGQDKFNLGITDGAVGVISDNDGVLSQCIAGNLEGKGVRLAYCGMGTNIINVNAVVPDNYAGAVQATKHLIECGHKRIVFVSVLNGSMDRRHNLRIQGWQDTMQKAELEMSEIMRWYIHKHSEDVINILKKIKNGDNDAPTALLVANDAMAGEIMNAAMMIGIRIPQDLSIIGFENHYIKIEPEITTVTCVGANFGREAVSLIDKVLAYPDCQPMRVHLPMQLMERGSVRNIEK